MNNNIRIIDWTGNILFEGHYDDPDVEETLEANRCKECIHITDDSTCDACDNTGYSGDFYIEWEDPDRDDNVYEFTYY